MLKSLPIWVSQVLAVSLACISYLCDKVHCGWKVPNIPILESPDALIHVTHTNITWIEITNTMGGFCSLPFTIFLVDKIGTRNSHLISICIGVFCWILLATSQRIEQNIFAQFFSGIAGDVALLTTSLFIAERANLDSKGRLWETTYLIMLVELLLMYIIAPFVKTWVPAVMSVGILLVSLYYLLMKGRNGDAKNSLQWFRSKEEAEEEISDIAAAVERQQTGKGRVQDLIPILSNRKVVTIMSILNGAEHFTGINVIFLIVHATLSATHSVYLDHNITAVVLALLILTAGSLVLSFADKFRWKILLSTFTALTGLCLAVLAGFYVFKNAGYNITRFNIIPTLVVILYAVVFKAGLGIIPIILTDELFPTSVKALGMTVADSLYVILSIISLHSYQWLTEAYGKPFVLSFIL